MATISRYVPTVEEMTSLSFLPPKQLRPKKSGVPAESSSRYSLREVKLTGTSSVWSSQSSGGVYNDQIVEYMRSSLC